jgi:hypothetical protein
MNKFMANIGSQNLRAIFWKKIKLFMFYFQHAKLESALDGFPQNITKQPFFLIGKGCNLVVTNKTMWSLLWYLLWSNSGFTLGAKSLGQWLSHGLIQKVRYSWPSISSVNHPSLRVYFFLGLSQIVVSWGPRQMSFFQRSIWDFGVSYYLVLTAVVLLYFKHLG